MGRGDLLKGMWDAWKAGDRKGALAAIPDVVVDDLFIHGTPEACREHLERYFDNGVTTAALALVPFGVDPRQAMRDMAPAKG
jgi:alkanesulfonate monooxygenase SsuD/methylene tetrahydromethanopterin reductase-like flavin-dependent oxidoreductase (luciferase family)